MTNGTIKAVNFGRRLATGTRIRIRQPMVRAESNKAPQAPRDVLQTARSFEALRQQYGLSSVPADKISRSVSAIERIADPVGADDVPAKIAARVATMWPHLQPITLAPPRTASWNASVFRVRAAGKTVAVAKNFGAKWRDFLSEVTALWHLRQRPGDRLATVAMLGAGHTVLDGEPQPFLIMEAPGDEDLENLQVAATESRSWQRYLRYVSRAGELVAAVHQRFGPSQDIESIEQSRKGHVSLLRSVPNTSLADLKQRGWLTTNQYAAWCRHIAEVTAAYAALPAQDLHLAVTLGDCYAANFVVHREGFGLSLVDVQTTLWNMDRATPPAGIGDAREDIGRFLEALTMRGVCLGLSARRLRAQQRAFWRGYHAHAGSNAVSRHDPHLQLYRLRFQAVVWRAVVDGRTGKVSLDEARRYLQHATRRITASTTFKKLPISVAGRPLRG